MCQRDSCPLLFELTIQNHQLRACGSGAGEHDSRVDGTGGAERRAQCRHRVAGESEQRVEPGTCRTRRAVGGGHVRFGGVECQIGLQHVETRCVALLEARLRRRARALGQVAEITEHHQPRAGDGSVEIAASDVVSHLRDRRLELGRADLERRLFDRDPLRALASQLDWHGDAEGLLRRVLLDLECQLRIRTLAGDPDACLPDGTAQAGGSNGRIGGEGAFHGLFERQWIQGRGLRGRPRAKEHRHEAHAHDGSARGPRGEVKPHGNAGHRAGHSMTRR